MEQSYGVLWDCIVAFVSKETTTRRERRVLFPAFLANLLQLARQNEACRLRALRIALRYGLHYTPESLFTLLFAKFAARLVIPIKIRQWIRSIVKGIGVRCVR